MTADQGNRPPHHDPNGGFRNPWGPPRDRSFREGVRWARERREKEMAPDPDPSQLPLAHSEILSPRGSSDSLRITWVGHATFLIQIGGFNLLTDPHWSPRASPVQWAGPSRFVPPGVGFEELPPIDAVLLSHDHYDHLDAPTVQRLGRHYPDAVWYTPLGYRDWLRRRRIRHVAELDWWESATASREGGESIILTAVPAQHWTRRGLVSQQRLWSGWVIESAAGRVFFGGDSGYCPAFREIGDRFPDFDVSLIPIGAYEPRWFMEHDHMNPAEAVHTYGDLGGRGLMVGMHWGTFRLTDEDPLEPPRLARREWQKAGLPAGDLWIPRHGETRVLR